MINKFIKNKKGFGAVELIVTIVIVGVAMVSLMGLVSKIIEGSKRSRINIVTLNLAREGIEVIRNKRDSNWLSGANWDNGFNAGTNRTAILDFDKDTNTWSLDFTPNSITEQATKLYLDTSARIYSHDSNNTATDFSRLIDLDLICRDNTSGLETIRTSGNSCQANETKVGLQVKSTVRYSGRVDKDTIIIDKIYNWR